MRIVCISDTHELHRELEVPNGDILVHAGDFTFMSKSMTAVRDFNEWLGELPHQYKIVIPGNHEFFLEKRLEERRLLSNATVLINESLKIGELTIWGSPATPLYGGAFGVSRAADRVRLYRTIPSDTQILITHGPPYGILDREFGSTEPTGDLELLDAVKRICPRLHIFGHVHGGYGTYHDGNTLFVNASMLTADGDVDRMPIVVDL